MWDKLVQGPSARWILGGVLAILAGWLYRDVPEQRLTRLDDSIFIEEQYAFNREDDSYAKALTRGVFVPKGDSYYRPLLIWSFVADAHQHQLRLKGYLKTNVLLHVLSCVLIFLALGSLGFGTGNAFALALVFVVHPALSQAVAWIPGRNDSLLAAGTFAALIGMERWLSTGRWGWLILQAVMGLATLLTKETGVVVLPALSVLVWACRGPLGTRFRWAALGIGWLMSLTLWYVGRAQAGTLSTGLEPSNLAALWVERLPMLVQYLGKMFLPFNLCVFPIQDDTTLQWGVLSLLGLGILLWFAPPSTRRAWTGGLLFWFLLLVPAMVVPKGLNDQVFEHRLYVPALGLLVAVGSTDLFLLKWTLPYRAALLGVVAFFYAQINLNHREVFRDELVFWKNAVDHAPSSAYAHVMYAIRCNTVQGLPRPGMEVARTYVNRAYALDSNEKYVNHYMGLVALEDKRYAEAERYFGREIRITALADSYFNRARAFFELGRKREAAGMLEAFLQLRPGDPSATNNLKLLYQELGDTASLRKLP